MKLSPKRQTSPPDYPANIAQKHVQSSKLKRIAAAAGTSALMLAAGCSGSEQNIQVFRPPGIIVVPTEADVEGDADVSFDAETHDHAIDIGILNPDSDIVIHVNGEAVEQPLIDQEIRPAGTMPAIIPGDQVTPPGPRPAPPPPDTQQDQTGQQGHTDQQILNSKPQPCPIESVPARSAGI